MSKEQKVVRGSKRPGSKSPPAAASSPEDAEFQQHRLLVTDNSQHTSTNKRDAEEIQFMLMGVEEGMGGIDEEVSKNERRNSSKQANQKSKHITDKKPLTSALKGKKNQQQVIYQGIIGKELKLFPNKQEMVPNPKHFEKRHMSINDHRSALESIKSGTEMRHQSSEVGPTDIDINQSFGMMEQDDTLPMKNYRKGSILEKFSDQNLQNANQFTDSSQIFDKEQEHRMIAIAQDVKKHIKMNARKKQQQQLLRDPARQPRQTVFSNFQNNQKSQGNFVKQLKDSYNVLNQQQNMSYAQQNQTNYNSGINILHAQLPRGTPMNSRPRTGDGRSRAGAANKLNRFNNKSYLLNQNSSAIMNDFRDARSNKQKVLDHLNLDKDLTWIDQPQYPRVLLAQQQGKMSHLDSHENAATGAFTLDASFSKEKGDNAFSQVEIRRARPQQVRPQTTQQSVKNRRKDSIGLMQAFQNLKELGSGLSLNQQNSKRAGERGSSGAAMSRTIEPPLKFDPSTYMNTLKGVQTYEQIQSNILQIKGILEKEKQTKNRGAHFNTLRPEDLVINNSHDFVSEAHAATDGAFNMPSYKVSNINSPNFAQVSDLQTKTIEKREKAQGTVAMSHQKTTSDYMETNQDPFGKVPNQDLKSPNANYLNIKEQKSSGNQSVTAPSNRLSLKKSAFSTLLPLKTRQSRRLTALSSNNQRKESRVKFQGLSQSTKSNSKFRIKQSKTLVMPKKNYSYEKSQSEPSDHFVDNDKDDVTSSQQKQIDFAEAFKSSYLANQSFLRKIEEKLMTISVKQGHQSDSDSDQQASEIETKLRNHFKIQQEQISMGLETYIDIDSIPQRKELNMYLKTLKTESKINKAKAMIQRINAKMKHHILQSEYYSGVDTHGCDMKSKYIDLIPGTAKEVKLLGNVYDDDDHLPKQSKNKEPIMKKVPLLFRIMEVKEDESYFFTIKQMNPNQQIMSNHRSTCYGQGPVEETNQQTEAQQKEIQLKLAQKLIGSKKSSSSKLDLLRKTAKKKMAENQFQKKMMLLLPKPGAKKPPVADLQVYISNNYSNPSAYRNDKAYENDIRNDKSRIMQFNFQNKTVEDALSPKANKLQATDNNEKKVQFYKVPCIYIAIQSKMGCNIRIMVQTGEAKNEKKETVSFQSKKALIDERYNECDPKGVNADLTEFFDENANNWDFDAFERHKHRIQSSEFDSKVQKLVNNYKRELRQQNEKQISKRRNEIMAMERLRKIRSINYWDDYKMERNRLIDVAIQLQRTKFLIKRLLAIRLITTLPSMINEKMRACRVKYLYRSSQLFLSLKFYIFYKNIQKHHGPKFNERQRKKIIKPCFTIACRSIFQNQSHGAMTVLAAFFNCCDQKLKFTNKLQICFQKIKKIQSWMRKPTQQQLEESMVRMDGDILNKKYRRTLPNLWTQHFIRMRYIRSKFMEERIFVIEHFKRPKNLSGNNIANTITNIKDSLLDSVLNYFTILKQKEYMVYYLTYAVGHLQGRLKQLRDTLQKLKNKQMMGRLNIKQSIEEVDEILSNEMSDTVGSPINYKKSAMMSPKSISSGTSMLKNEESRSKKSDVGARQLDGIEQQQVEDFTAFLILKYQTQIGFFEREVEAKKVKREAEIKMVYQLNQHLYQGLDEFLMAERTVDYSFNCMIERIAAHYDNCQPNDIIEEIHEQTRLHAPCHEPQTKYDETMNYEYQQKKEKKKKMGHGRGNAKHGSNKQASANERNKQKLSRKSFQDMKISNQVSSQSNVKTPQETQCDVNQIMQNALDKLKQTNYELQPFKAHITREEVHKLIFCCCNYDKVSERVTDKILQGCEEEEARELVDQEIKAEQTLGTEQDESQGQQCHGKKNAAHKS